MRYAITISFSNENAPESYTYNLTEKVLLFTPTYFIGQNSTKKRKRKYNDDIFADCLSVEIASEKQMYFDVTDDIDGDLGDNTLLLQNGKEDVCRNYIHIDITLTDELFNTHMTFIESVIVDCAERGFLISACMRASNEPEFVNANEHTPGYTRNCAQGGFGAFWKTWIGKWGFPFAPPYIVKTCSSILHREIHDNYIYLHFFEDAKDFNNPENNASRWDFRKKTGILYCVENQSYMQDGIQIPDWLPHLKSVELQLNEDSRIVTRYLDANNEVVTPDKAIKKYVDIFSHEGDLLNHVEEMISISTKKG